MPQKKCSDETTLELTSMGVPFEKAHALIEAIKTTLHSKKCVEFPGVMTLQPRLGRGDTTRVTSIGLVTSPDFDIVQVQQRFLKQEKSALRDLDRARNKFKNASTKEQRKVAQRAMNAAHKQLDDVDDFFRKNAIPHEDPRRSDHDRERSQSALDLVWGQRKAASELEQKHTLALEEGEWEEHVEL